jgi:hypothetical protein
LQPSLPTTLFHSSHFRQPLRLFVSVEHQHGSTHAPQSGHFSRWRMTSNFTSLQAGVCRDYEFHQPRTNLFMSAQALPSTHAQQALHSTLNCLRLREYVEGNSYLHFNLSHSTPTRIPDRRQSNRSPPIKTSGHSHLRPYPFNRVSIPF